MSEKVASADPAAEDWGRVIEAIAVSQDRAAFARLFAYFAPRVKTVLKRSGSSEQMAEELAQETMLTVWRKASQFDPQSTGAAAWIFTIARNLRIDAVRRDRRGGITQVHSVDVEFIADPATPGDQVVAAAQAQILVHRALTTLPADQLRIVELSFFEDRPHGEIAELLSIPLGTVKSRLRLAMNKLRALLGDLL